MRTFFEHYDATKVLQKFENVLGVRPDTSCQRTEFQLPEKMGEGMIGSYRFHDGLALFVIAADLYQDWTWVFDSRKSSPVYFLFPLSGHISEEKPDGLVLKPLHTFLVKQPGGVARNMVLKKGEPVRLAVLRIDHEVFFDKKACGLEELPEKMRQIVSRGCSTGINYLMPPDSTAPEALQLINDVIHCPHSGLLRTCYVEAKARQLLAWAMQRMLREEDKPDWIDKADLLKIHKAKEILISDLKKPPTIPELSREVAINRQKLKRVFKSVYGKTIYQYLLSERMKAAKKLIAERQLTVAEVAATVGYASSSHFSRRFKEHFGMSPGHFFQLVWRKTRES